MLPFLRKIFEKFKLSRPSSQTEPEEPEPAAPKSREESAPKPNSLFPQFHTVFNNLKQAYVEFLPEADEALEEIRTDFLNRWTALKNRSSFDGLEDTVSEWREADAGYRSLFADSSVNAFSSLERLYDEAFPSQKETRTAQPVLAEA